VLHVYLLGVPEAVSLLGSGVYRHDDSIFSASAYSVTQKPSRDCHCILDPDRAEALCNTIAASFQLYKSPWLDSLHLLTSVFKR